MLDWDSWEVSKDFIIVSGDSLIGILGWRDSMRVSRDST